MGFIVDAVSAVLKFIWNTIVKIIGLIVSFIDFVHTLFLYWIHEIKQQIAAWMTDPLLGAVGVLCLLLIIATSGAIYQFASNIGIIGLFQALSAIVNSTLEKIAIFIHFRELLLISDVLELVWADYKQLMSQFYRAIGSFSADLGYETSFITHALRNAKTVILNAATLAGIPPEYVELETIDLFAQQFQKMEDNFLTYAKNPEWFLHDIDENIVYPYMQVAAETQNEILVQVQETIDTVKINVDNFLKLKQSVDVFIEDLPSEIKTEIEKWYKPISDRIDDIYYNDILPIYQRIDDVEQRFLDYKTLVERDIAANKEKARLIASNLLDLASTDAKTFWQELDALSCMVMSGIMRTIEKFNAAGKGIKNPELSEMNIEMATGLAPNFLEYERVSIRPINVDEKIVGNSWNQGDY